MSTTELQWTGTTGQFTAEGDRGTYTIKCVGRLYVLTGLDGNGLPMPTLPPEGRPFEHLVTAQKYATELDRTRTPDERRAGM